MAFCNFGSGFNKPSQWLHNKPWLDDLAGPCRCPFRGRHFVIEGSFTKASVKIFNSRCRPADAVYGREPRVGEAVSSYAAAYPRSLCAKMAAGSLAAFHAEQEEDKLVEGSGQDARPWHSDPDWIREVCDGLPFRELFRYRFKKSGHINTLECRVYKSWLKYCAKSRPNRRLLALLDSRVTMGAAAKGRSSSESLSHILKTSLGYVLGGGLYPGCHHCRSKWNKADDPSRDRDVAAPLRQPPL